MYKIAFATRRERATISVRHGSQQGGQYQAENI